MGVDLAHEAVLIPAERWQRWHKIARAIGTTTIALAKELCIANTALARRNLYWAVTAARILVQWTTGDQQRLANAITAELEGARRTGALSSRLAPPRDGWEGRRKNHE